MGRDYYVVCNKTKEMDGTMDNKCGNCKWWGVSKNSNDKPDAIFRQCGRVVHDKRGGASDFEWDDEEDFAKKSAMPIRQELAVVVDGSGYHAALKCREDFGCVLFEKKSDSSLDSIKDSR